MKKIRTYLSLLLYKIAVWLDSDTMQIVSIKGNTITVSNGVGFKAGDKIIISKV